MDEEVDEEVEEEEEEEEEETEKKKSKVVKMHVCVWSKLKSARHFSSLARLLLLFFS